MFCPNCGSQMEDGSMFCPNCGQQVANEQIAKKKGIGKLLVILPVIALVVVAGFLGIRLLSHSNGDISKQMAYVKNDTLYFVKNMDSEKTIKEVARLRSEDEESARYFFSDGGKYLYFFTRMSGSTGRLCRIEVSKIKNNTEKNESIIQEIDTDVKAYSVETTKNYGVLYSRSSNDLYYYHGKQAEKIDRDVAYFNYDDELDKVYYAKKVEESDYDLYYATLGKQVQVEKMDRDVKYLADKSNLNFMVYCKGGDQETTWNEDTETYDYQNPSDLYVASLGKTPERISDQCYSVLDLDAESGKVMYMTATKEVVSLGEYVDNDCVDGNISEPDYRDFMSEISEKKAVSEDDYDYYFSNHPYDEDDDDYYYYDYGTKEEFYDDLGYDNNVEMSRYYNEDTDEYYYYDYDDKKWYKLDEDLYNKAYEKYESQNESQDLLKELNEESFDRYKYNVYVYSKNGNSQLLLENVDVVLSGNVKSSSVVYCKTEPAKMKLSEIEYTSDVEDFYDSLPSTVFCKVENGSETELGGTKDITVCGYSANGKLLALMDYDSQNEYKEIFIYPVGSKESIEKYSIAEGKDINTASWVENDYYYYTNISSDCADVNCYSSGKTETVLKDVEDYDSVCLQSDGCYTNSIYVGSNSGNDLYVYNNKGNKLVDFYDVSVYSYINSKRIVMLQSDILKVYNGKDEIIRLDSGVDNFCTSEENEGIWIEAE